MITTLAMIEAEITRWQVNGFRVVLATGVFDLLHIEHVRFLEKAKTLGDILVVGVETDARVKRIKGANRPIHPLAIRIAQLEALKSVDKVFVLPENFDDQTAWLDLLQRIHPAIYAASSNSSHLANKQALCAKAQIDFHSIKADNPAMSSTIIEQKLLELD
jgi:D-beta-D-heptose 7-phosphate kinase/D-beta-D-heptose 1-phosphate adenosyltransferase